MQGVVLEKLIYECGTIAKVVHNKDDTDHLPVFKRLSCRKCSPTESFGDKPIRHPVIPP